MNKSFQEAIRYNSKDLLSVNESFVNETLLVSCVFVCPQFVCRAPRAQTRTLHITFREQAGPELHRHERAGDHIQQQRHAVEEDSLVLHQR